MWFCLTRSDVKADNAPTETESETESKPGFEFEFESLSNSLLVLYTKDSKISYTGIAKIGGFMTEDWQKDRFRDGACIG